MGVRGARRWSRRWVAGPLGSPNGPLPRRKTSASGRAQRWMARGRNNYIATASAARGERRDSLIGRDAGGSSAMPNATDWRVHSRPAKATYMGLFDNTDSRSRMSQDYGIPAVRK